jgi:probable phosphoglycerate mutase
MNNPLNENGRQQAAAVAKRLAEESWDVLISSDLLRTRETAEAISAAIGLPIQYDRRLREIYRGQIEGTIEEERIAKWGEDWKKLDLGEETRHSVQQRGMEFVKDAAVQYPGKKLLVVSHGLLMGLTLQGILKDQSLGGDLHNTSVTTIQRNGEGWEYLIYGCTKHLD